MLLAHLEHAGVAVILTAEERDADVVIVRKAIELGEQDEVVVIADDTDVLVLLVYSVHMQFAPILYGKETSHYRHRCSAASSMC